MSQPQSQLYSCRNSPLRPKLRTIVIQKKTNILDIPMEPKSANSLPTGTETGVRSLIGKFKDITITQLPIRSKREEKFNIPIKIPCMKEHLKKTQTFQLRSIDIPKRLICKSYDNNSDIAEQQSPERRSAICSPEKAFSLVNTSRQNKLSSQDFSVKRSGIESCSIDATSGNQTSRGYSFEDKYHKRAQSYLRADSILPEIQSTTKLSNNPTITMHKRIQSQRV
jgi:hypothetical protein